MALADTNAETARLVALNDACPFSLRLKLTEHPDLQVRKNAWSAVEFRSRRKRRQLLQRVGVLLQHPRKHPELGAIASNKTIPSSLATRFATEKDHLPRIVAANPRLQDKERRRLLAQGDDKAARAALEHASGNEILWEGLRHPSANVRAALVSKNGLHASRIRFFLAKDKSPDVRHFLVSHLINNKNSSVSDKTIARAQVELVLASASPCEKRTLLQMRLLRKRLIEWKSQDYIPEPRPGL